MTFTFKLETPNGAAADPPIFRTAVPNWRASDQIPIGRRSLRVPDVRVAEDESVLVVEDISAALP
jgi:hypothetical protein